MTPCVIALFIVVKQIDGFCFTVYHIHYDKHIHHKRFVNSPKSINNESGF